MYGVRMVLGKVYLKLDSGLLVTGLPSIDEAVCLLQSKIFL